MSFYILLTQFILIFTFYITMVHLSKQRKEDKCACVCSVMSETLLTPWTIACKALLSLEFFRQEYWSGLPFSIPVDGPHAGIELHLLCLLHCQADSLPLHHLRLGSSA